MTMVGPKYSLKYSLSVDSKKHGFTREDAQDDQTGLTDALVLVSIIRGGDEPHEGGKSFEVVSFDGFNEQSTAIPDTEMFQVFSCFADALIHSDIPAWQREIAEATFGSIRKRVVNQKS